MAKKNYNGKRFYKNYKNHELKKRGTISQIVQYLANNWGQFWEFILSKYFCNEVIMAPTYCRSLNFLNLLCKVQTTFCPLINNNLPFHLVVNSWCTILNIQLYILEGCIISRI